MENFFSQIEKCLDAELYHPALVCTLILPDICAALSAPAGKTTRELYKKWYTKYVGYFSDIFDPDNCWNFRCSIIHEGTTSWKDSKYVKVLFIPPDLWKGKMHFCVSSSGGSKALIIDVNMFCHEMINGGKKWFTEMQKDENFKKNYPKFIKFHPDGFAPFIGGIPVIG